MAQEYIEWHPSEDGGSLGRHIDHDERSREFAFTEDAVPTLHTIIHTRKMPILDQDLTVTYQGATYNGTGSCTGNSAVGALGSEPVYATVGDKIGYTETNALDIYSAATQIDGFGDPFPTNDRGSSGLAVAKVCQKAGYIYGYQHCFSLTAMQKALQVRPVIVGTNWYDSMDTPGTHGVVTISPNAQVRGGHEYEVIGIDVEAKLFQCVNSWGTGWGEQGHFWISWDDMNRLLGEKGDCTVFVPIQQPAPTPPAPPTPMPTPTPSGPSADDIDRVMWNYVKQFINRVEQWAKDRNLDH